MNPNDFYNRPISVADGIYWVGSYDARSYLHCNPYLVVAGDMAVLIDGGSRSDFATVMMKILQAEIDPTQIAVLIYQHADPDLCGSMSNMVDICKNSQLRIFSNTIDKEFLKYYLHQDRSHLVDSIDKHAYRYNLNGRILSFHPTPYAHSSGSYITYDLKTKTLFTSDLFGSIAPKWDLFLNLADDCIVCDDTSTCKLGKEYCLIRSMISFHKQIMPCCKALKHAMGIIKELAPDIIAPQHGSIITNKRDMDFLIDKLEKLENVGVDGLSQVY
jgi:flavorubredoxin